MTDDEIHAEADRLVALDEAGRAREAVVIALRLGQQSEYSARELAALDYAFLREFSNVGATGEVSDGERLDA